MTAQAVGVRVDGGNHSTKSSKPLANDLPEQDDHYTVLVADPDGNEYDVV
jgi:hypothetical protein